MARTLCNRIQINAEDVATIAVRHGGIPIRQFESLRQPQMIRKNVRDDSIAFL